MHLLLLILWLFSVYIGLKTLIKETFDKNISFFKHIFLFFISDHNLNKIKKNTFIKKISFSFNTIKLKIDDSPFSRFIFYTSYLYLITIISLLILPVEDPASWLTWCLSALLVIAIFIIPLLLIIYIIKTFISAIKSILNENLKPANHYIKNIKLFLKTLFILISPALLFTLIYGILDFIESLYKFELAYLLDEKNLLYSFSISFPIPTNEMNIVDKNIGFKIISIIQVIIQKLVEICILGFLMAYFYDKFKK